MKGKGRKQFPNAVAHMFYILPVLRYHCDAEPRQFQEATARLGAAAALLGNAER